MWGAGEPRTFIRYIVCHGKGVGRRAGNANEGHGRGCHEEGVHDRGRTIRSGEERSGDIAFSGVLYE